MLSNIISYLAESLGVKVATQRPDTNTPSEMVTIVRTGGGGDRFIDRPRLVCHCWSTSDANAYDLAQRTANYMLAAPDVITDLAYIEQDSFYANPYTDGTPRWSVVFVLVTKR